MSRFALDLLPLELWELIFQHLPPRASLVPAAAICRELNEVAIRCHLRRCGLRLDEDIIGPELHLTLSKTRVLALYLSQSPLPTRTVSFGTHWPADTRDLFVAVGRLERVLERMPALRELNLPFGRHLYRLPHDFRLRIAALFAGLACRAPGRVLVCGSQIMATCSADELRRDVSATQSYNPLLSSEVRSRPGGTRVLPLMCVLDAHMHILEDEFSILALNRENLSYFSIAEDAHLSFVPYIVPFIRYATFPSLRTLHLGQHVPLAAIRAFLENHGILARLEYTPPSRISCSCSSPLHIEHPPLSSVQLRIGPDAERLIALLQFSKALHSYEMLLDEGELPALLRVLDSFSESASAIHALSLTILSSSVSAKTPVIHIPGTSSLCLASVQILDINVPSIETARAMIPFVRAVGAKEVYMHLNLALALEGSAPRGVLSRLRRALASNEKERVREQRLRRDWAAFHQEVDDARSHWESRLDEDAGPRRCDPHPQAPNQPCARCKRKGLSCQYTAVSPTPQQTQMQTHPGHGSPGYEPRRHRLIAPAPPSAPPAPPLPYTGPPPTHIRPRYADAGYPDLSLAATTSGRGLAAYEQAYSPQPANPGSGYANAYGPGQPVHGQGRAHGGSWPPGYTGYPGPYGSGYS
ncbi:hypothetical protein MKEN_00986000 [Mycena kentingensis (nom. inval.)]|nr:hypothetical protein MKEN_00986000 [Mycena kentingensis (nom. inval.)]